MPRRRNPDAPAAPKAPRVRKKKAEAEVVKQDPVYEPLMQSNGIMMDDGMYTQDFGYAFGSQPPFTSPEPASSPYMLPPQSNTPQPPMMMRQMAPTLQSGAPMPAPAPPQPMNPAPSPLEFRIHDMNRRLYIFNSSGICEKDFAQWWDAFSHEFFDDDAKLWVNILDEHSPHLEKYIIGRQLIPRFFRSFFESGIREMYYVIRGQSRESPALNGMVHYENDNILQVTKHDCPNAEVQTKFKLFIEFTPYDEMLNYRIRTWSMELETCQEFLLNELTKEYEIHHADGLDKPLTRMGLPSQTLTCLSMSRILEPMQMLMSQSKSGGLSPRTTLRHTLFAHYHKVQAQQQAIAMQQINQPPMLPPTSVEEQKPKPARKRQRKAAANSKSKKANASPAPTNPAFPPNPMPGNFTSMGFQDVMVVGEPSMMGGDYGEEDERTISRVENTQYDPNAMQMQSMGPSGLMGPGMSGMQSGPPMGPGGHQLGPGGSQIGPGGPQMGPGGPQMGPQMGPGGPLGPNDPQMVPGVMPPSLMGGPGMPPGPPQQLTQLGPPPNGHPQGYGYGQPQPGAWSNPPSNTTMITG